MANLDISERRPFNKTEYGWKWYKNLIIPGLKVVISQKEDLTNSSDLKVELRCYKRLTNNSIEDVKLNGK